MTSNIDNLLIKIKSLEQDLIEEIQTQQQDFIYEFKQRQQNLLQQNKGQLQQLYVYVKNAPAKHILSAPVVWAILIPTLVLDIFVSLYQAICFPIYNIPKVNRTDHLVFDRQYLDYLNVIEKINCAYCSYFTGIISYIQEIAARTEQFWCPIKHARRISTLHSRYQHFMDYGDAKSYRKHKEEIRKNFKDL